MKTYTLLLSLMLLTSCSVLDSGFQKQRYTDFRGRKHEHRVVNVVSAGQPETMQKNAEQGAVQDSTVCHQPDTVAWSVPELMTTGNYTEKTGTAQAVTTQHSQSESIKPANLLAEQIRSSEPKQNDSESRPMIGWLILLLIVGFISGVLLLKAGNPDSGTTKATPENPVQNNDILEQRRKLRLYFTLNLLSGILVIGSLALAVVLDGLLFMLIGLGLIIACVYFAVMSHKQARAIREQLGEDVASENKRLKNFTILAKVLAFFTYFCAIGTALLAGLAFVLF